MAKALMILGTASDVGKSVIAAGLCRLFYRSGIRVAPFKAQNMSLNSYVTLDGGEIGWAQAAQAQACGIEPTVDMNPVLLKPISALQSQVIVQGRVYRNMRIGDYYKAKVKIWRRIEQSYHRLSREYDLIVLEGAGGAAEINLRRHDLVNFRMARLANAEVLLIGDIERGGVFASLVGTLDLLPRQDQTRIKGLIINKFRGDVNLLKSGLTFLKRRTGLPVLGVLPYQDTLDIPEEDSVALERKKKNEKPFDSHIINIAVISFPHMANYTDFAKLEREPGVSLRYLTEREDLSKADVVILPGTKNTLHDLEWLRAQGWAEEILRYAELEGRVVGVCGGYQILGEAVTDPLGLEGKRKKGDGLGLLPVRTKLERRKVTQRVTAEYQQTGNKDRIAAYEIHMGRTEVAKPLSPAFTILERSGTCVTERDGAVSENGRIWGTYLHGIFGDSSFRRSWLENLFRTKGIDKECRVGIEADSYDSWASHLDKHLDTAQIFNLVRPKTVKKKTACGKPTESAEETWASVLS